MMLDKWESFDNIKAWEQGFLAYKVLDVEPFKM